MYGRAGSSQILNIFKIFKLCHEPARLYIQVSCSQAATGAGAAAASSAATGGGGAAAAGAGAGAAAGAAACLQYANMPLTVIAHRLFSTIRHLSYSATCAQHVRLYVPLRVQ